MVLPRAAKTQRRTRIQEEKEERILEAALEVFSLHGYRGATVDQIADVAGMSKPNLLYYFRTKEAMHRALINRVLAGGGDPSFVTLDQTGRFALVANYLGGNIAAFALRPDGGIGDWTGFAQHTGSSVNQQRQTACAERRPFP